MSDNFIKKTWVNGDVITAEELNRMEDGIDNSTTKYNELKTQSDENSDLIKEYLVSDNIIYSQPELVIGEAGDTNQKATFFTVDGPFTAGDVYTFVCDSIENAVASTILQANSMSSNDIIMKIDATTDPNDNDLSVTVTQQQIDNGLDRIVFSVNASDSTPLEDSCVITNPMIVKGDEFALQYTDEFEAIVSDIVEDTVRPPIEGMGNMLMELGNYVQNMTAAEASDVGKALAVAAVEDGRVTEWEFGGSSGNDSSKAPAIYNTVKGNPVTIFDGADGYPIKELVAEIIPQQEGYGVPSIENPREISGIDGIDITVCGVNLAKLDQNTDAYNEATSIEYTDNGAIISTSGNYGVRIFEFNGLEVDRKYYVSFSTNTQGSVLINAYQGNLLGFQADSLEKVYETNGEYSGYFDVDFYFTSTANNFYIAFMFPADENEYDTEISGLFLANTLILNNGLEPYTGSTYHFGFEDYASIYGGGTLDLSTGELTRTHVRHIVDPDNDSIQFYKTTSYGSVFYLNATDVLTQITLQDIDFEKYYKSNIFQYSSNHLSMMPLYSYSPASYGLPGYIFVLPSQINTIEKAGQWFREHPTEFIGEATEKTTYTLSSQQKVPVTIQGINNIFSNNGGGITAEYAADTKLYIQGSVVHTGDQNPTISILGGYDCTEWFCDYVSSINLQYPYEDMDKMLHIAFTVGWQGGAINTTDNIIWPDWFDPTNLEADTVYEINIYRMLALVTKWKLS